MPILDAREPQALIRAARALAAGELLGLPTETVYGLAARADDDAAVARIYAANGRPLDHPLIVHVADAQAAQAFVREVPGLPARARTLMARFWPGPLSLVVPRRLGVAEAAAAGAPTVALRCPAHPVAQALLREAARLGVPGLAAPSANRFGRVSPTQAEHVAAEFGPELLVLDGGTCQEGIESAIVDCSRAASYLLRPGTLARAAIEAALGEPLLAPDAAAPRTPGALASHYAPAAPVHLRPAGALEAAVRAEAAARPQGRIGVYSRQPLPGLGATAQVLAWPMPDNAQQAAHELFATLRRFDAEAVSSIWVEQPPVDTGWDGVRDRLQRAATR
ncbi:MAG: L-threonylcarbamoyladenylate synthase [Rubrivivax sp.]